MRNVSPMSVKHLLCAAALVGVAGCVEPTPELQRGNGAANLTIQTNLTNGRGPSTLLTTRKAWLHVATLSANCSVETYLGRSVMGAVPSLALTPSKAHAFEVVINVKAGFDTVAKKTFERSVFVRPGYSYILDAQLEPNNDLIDLYEIAPNGTKRRIDTDHTC